MVATASMDILIYLWHRGVGGNSMWMIDNGWMPFVMPRMMMLENSIQQQCANVR